MTGSKDPLLRKIYEPYELGKVTNPPARTIVCGKSTKHTRKINQKPNTLHHYSIKTGS